MVASQAHFAYLDHAATTPMRAEAIAAMQPYLADQFANPSGSHRASRNARLALTKRATTLQPCSDAHRAKSCSPAAVPRVTTPPSLVPCVDMGVRQCVRLPNTTPCCIVSSTYEAKLLPSIIAESSTSSHLKKHCSES